MKRLLFQSDDYGITEAVSKGIIKGIQDGIIRNTGMFVNMPCSAVAAENIKQVDVCLGIDINLVAGRPVTDPKLIPHLVDEQGNFITSRKQLASNKLVSMDDIIFHFEEDPYPYDEVLLETENQLKRFIDLTGKMPEYFHPHSLCTPNTEKAAKEIAEKHGIFQSVTMMYDTRYRQLPGAIVLSKNASIEDQIQQDVEKDLLETTLPALQEGETGYYICHCGYVDYDLFLQSSLTLRRIKDLSAVLSPAVKEYLAKNEIELISYRDL